MCRINAVNFKYGRIIYTAAGRAGVRRLKRISRRTGQEVRLQCNLITRRPHRPALPKLNNKNVSAPTNEATHSNIATHKAVLYAVL